MIFAGSTPIASLDRGAIQVQGDLDSTLGAATLSATGTVTVVGILNVTLEPAFLVAKVRGTSIIPFGMRRQRLGWKKGR